MEVKFNATVMENNRKRLNNVGSSFGGKFFRIGKYQFNDNYGVIINQVHNAGNVDLCLNRDLQRFKVDGFDIHKVEFKTAPDGTSCVYINEDDKNSKGENLGAVLPVSTIAIPFKPATDTEISKAIENPANKNIIFADPDNIANQANQYNLNEIARIDAMIEMLNKAKNVLIQTNENNTKRAQEYKKQLNSDGVHAEANIVGHVEI